VIWLNACATPDSVEAEGIPQMSAVEALVRTSLDLRGVRPTVAEIAAVETDAAALESAREGFLADPRFEARVMDLWSEIYLTRTETYGIAGSAYGLDDATFLASVGDEPLRILGHIAQNDLPYTDLVTADWTMADETLAAAWPIEHRGSGWQKSHYTDGRPAAGVLSTNGMWWRYTSTDSNANRKRANAISRILLCNDYLSRPIEFDRNVNLLDEEAVNGALTTNPACVNCHDSLDPIASYLFGFWWYDYTNPLEASFYFPEREQRWKGYTNSEPAWYGTPGYSLSDLGHQIAGDHRYPACATEQAFELLLRRESTVEDADALTGHRNAFIEGGLTVRALLRSVVTDPRYLAGATDAEGYVPKKMATPGLLASQIEDLTGFRWTYAGYDMLGSDAVGVRTLAGGADGYDVTSTATSPNATLVLVQERLAEGASSYVVYSEPERLFTLDFSETPDTDRDAMVAQIQALHLRIFGTRVAADGDEVEAALGLWAALYEVERDPQAAWAGVLSALLRDPDLLFY
jgi:hypothetical protein